MFDKGSDTVVGRSDPGGIRHLDGAGRSPIGEGQLRAGAEGARKGLLQQFRPKPAMRRVQDRSPGLPPFEPEHVPRSVGDDLPGDGDPALGARERSVFQGIGCKLVDCQPQRLGSPRLKPDTRPADLDLLSLLCAVGEQLLRDEELQVDPFLEYLEGKLLDAGLLTEPVRVPRS